MENARPSKPRRNMSASRFVTCFSDYCNRRSGAGGSYFLHINLTVLVEYLCG
jgi:hypothetical protein